jgi:hypothetical protein
MDGPGYTPSHPALFEVQFQTANTPAHSSRLVAIKKFMPHEVLATIDIPREATNHPREKDWSTIQVSRTRHLDILANDLVYMNHSCDPTAIFKVAPGSKSVSVIAGPKGIGRGEAITFFYPSTEWEMSRPFECFCGAGSCLKVIRGAKFLDAVTLRRWYINDHIWELKSKLRQQLHDTSSHDNQGLARKDSRDHMASLRRSSSLN